MTGNRCKTWLQTLVDSYDLCRFDRIDDIFNPPYILSLAQIDFRHVESTEEEMTRVDSME